MDLKFRIISTQGVRDPLKVLKEHEERRAELVRQIISLQEELDRLQEVCDVLIKLNRLGLFG